MATSNNTTLSKTILFLRFPLIMAVVFIHTRLHRIIINGVSLVDPAQFPIFNSAVHLITYEIACIAVPLFFFFSGFLFFYQTRFSLPAYKQKLQSRVRSLLIPYLFWNIAVFCITLLAQIFLSSMLSGQYKLITDYNIHDWIGLFWAVEGTTEPICYQFWYIRDLMIMLIFTPLLYILVKYSNWVSIAIFGILWMLYSKVEIPGFSFAGLFFFTSGAWFGINNRNFIDHFRKMRLPATLIYLILIATNTWLFQTQTAGNIYVHNAGILMGMIATVSWTAYGIENRHLKTNSLLAGSAFFVYAYHGMPTTFAIKIWVKLLQPMTDFTLTLGYLIIPMLIAAIGIGAYAILHRYLPSFTAIITGGR